MRFALKFTTGGFILCILLTCRVWATPLFPQEADTDDEDEEEEDEDAYDEEENTSKKPDGVTEKEELDSVEKSEKQDAAVRKLLSTRLGITNFSRKALAEKATHFAVSYIISRSQAGQPTPRPRKKVKPPPPASIPSTTQKYREIPNDNTTKLDNATIESNGNQTQNQVMRTFFITVPHGLNGTGGGTIEINIPMLMMSKDGGPSSSGMAGDHTSQMSITSEDEQGIRNIEAAIMEALILAQQMTPMTLSTSNSADNNTETIELDIRDISATTEDDESPHNEGITSKPPQTLSSSSSPLTEQKDIPPPPTSAFTEESPTMKPTKRRRERSTTPEGPIAGDTLAAGPATDVFVSQIRSGQLPQFLWKSVIKLANSKYAQIAVDAVECAVFYYCPNDSELGTLSNGAKF